MKYVSRLLILAIINFFGGQALLAVSNHPFQVGPTGFYADWDSGDDFVVVSKVQSGGPANGVIEVGDIIWKVNGDSLSDSYFTSIGNGTHHDPRVALGNAITDSEAGNGEITFDIERNGNRSDYTIQLAITNTAYSATWPDSCPKSDLIIQQTADRYVGSINSGLTWETGGHMASFMTLFLLSTGEEQHLDAVRTLMGSLGTETISTGSNTGRTNNWYGSLKTIAVAEYYIRTGDTAVLPNLQNDVNHAFATESVGGWGHGWSVGQTGFVKADYVGSGLVNAVGGQVFTGVALSRECGVTISDEDFEKSLRYYYQTAGVGAPIYGDHRYNEGGAVNGKLSLAGAGISMLNEPYASAAKMIGAMDGYNADAFEGGHSGNFGNVLWRAITSGLNEHEGSYRYMMDTMRWYFELCRDYDGTFTLLPAFDSTRYDDDAWGAMVGLNYVAARNNLRMTGAPPTEHSVIRHVPEVIPKHHEYFLITHAEGYEDSDYGSWMGEWINNGTVENIHKHMRHWHPKVRYHASIALGHLANDDNLSPLNSDGDPDNDLTDPAVDMIIEAIESDDARVRTAGLKAITGLEPFYTADFTDYDYDEDDYRRMAPYVLSILRDPDSDHWELDAATWAMIKVPVDIVRDNTDALLPLLEYEYVWYVRVGAYKALSRLSGADLAPHYMELLECFVRMVNNPARNAMVGHIKSDVNSIRYHISDSEFQAILNILGDDLSGGVYERDQGYQGAGGHVHERQTLKALVDTFDLEELGTIANDINSALSRYSNPRLRGLDGEQGFMDELYDWYTLVDHPLWRGTEEELLPFYPGFSAMLSTGFDTIVTWDDSRYGEAEEVFEFIEDTLIPYQSANGLVPVYHSHDFTADPATILGPNPAPFPDHEDQGIHYKLEIGSGASVPNHGMNSFSADAQMSDPAGWSNVGIAPYSNYSLNANEAWVFADNPHLVDRETSGRIEDRIRDGSYITSAWVRLNDTLPDSDSHFVVFSALYDFDFGVRRLDVNGEWKNTLFFEAANWGNSIDPIYAMNDSLGRPDIFLEAGKDYFIMFERRRNYSDNEKTLLHLYDPEQNVWLISNGNHGSALGNVTLDTRGFHIGIGSITSDVLDTDTRFPGYIDSVQMWSHVNKVNPQTLTGQFTLARQNALVQVTESPSAMLVIQNVDGISALLDGHLAKAGPVGSVLTVYYGETDGGTNPANWDHSITYSLSDKLEAREVLIEGLLPDNNYYARAHVQNPVGAMLEFWTPQPVTFSTLSAAGDSENPVANAGLNVVVIDDDLGGTATVTLDGSGSTDNIAIQTYTWTFANGDLISTGSDAIQTAEIPTGFHVITLTTTDFNGNTAQSQFAVDVIGGDNPAAPNAVAGLDQVVVDYDSSGSCLVQFDGSESGSNGVTPTSITWEIDGQVVASGANPYVDLAVGEHFVVMTVEGASGDANQDSFAVEVISVNDAMLARAELSGLDNHVIIAAQDFTGMGEGLVTGSGEIHYTESTAPNREIPFWSFTTENDTDGTGVITGITKLNAPVDPIAEQEAYIVDTRTGFSSTRWWYFSDPIDVSAFSNCRIAAEMQVFAGNYNSSNYLRSKVHMELDDGTIEVQELFFITGSTTSSSGPFIGTYDIPNDVKYVWMEVSGKSANRWMGVDNVILVGQVPEPAIVEVQTPDRINATNARVKGAVIDTGRENPNIKIYYGTMDRGETTAGWDGVVDLGTRSGGFNTTLTGLSELTTYYYRVYAENAGGESFSPTAATFRTGSSTPIDPAVISILPSSDIAANSLTLNAQVDDTSGDTPSITIFYGDNDGGTNTNNWDNSADLGYQSGSFSQSLSGLNLYETIYYRVRAVNFGGTTWSDTESVTTTNPGSSVFFSIQNNVDMTAASWDRGTIPGAGDIAIMDDYLRFRQLDGESFDADQLILSNQLRIYNSISFNDLVLFPGSTLYQQNSDDTATFDTITVHQGLITYNGNRSNQKIAANRIVGDGELTWRRPNSTQDLTNLAEIDCADMTGFTGLLTIGGSTQSGGPVDLTQDILSGDASFAMHIVGDGNFFVLSGQVAVTDLTVDKDYFAAGTYTLDTATNPSAIDLTDLNGRDYSPFFGDLGGTITVTGVPPAIELPVITTDSETNITIHEATINGEIITTGGQSPSITLFYGETDQGASTTGWDGAINLGIQSRSFSHTLSSLTHNTEYFYRFYATNSAGGTFISNTEAFTTLELRSPIVEVSPAGAVTSTAARIKGRITDDGNAPTTVTFYYGTNDGGEVAGNWSNTVSIGEHRNGSVSTFLSSLAPNEVYYYRIHVSNEGGESWSSSTQHFTAKTSDDFVYLHYFNGPSGQQIHGVAPDFAPGAEVWDNANSSNSNFFADGAVSGGGTKRKGIWLPLTPTAGNIYTLSADILSNQGGDGIALCYSQYNANARWDIADVNPYGSILVRSEANNRTLLTYTGVIKNGQITVPTDQVPDFGYVEVSVVLDASDADPATWTMEFFVEGVSVRGPDMVGSGSFADIRYIGLSKNTGGGSVRDVTLTESAPATKPSIVSHAEMGLTATTADIHGEVTSTGGETPHVILFYGENDQGETKTGWEASIDVGYETGIFAQTITGLLAETTYQYRLYAENSAGGVFSGAESFTTLAPPDSNVDFATWPSTILPAALESEYNTNPNIDFDGDGLSMIKEFYFGKDPLRSDSNALIEIEHISSDSTFRFIYERRKNHRGVLVAYEYSTDLAKWDPLVVFNEATEDTTVGKERVTIEIPDNSGDSVFIRVQIQPE
ncbi:MAG: DUF6288 domain-containing protein [Verrucomicrobiota bacterium]